MRYVIGLMAAIWCALAIPAEAQTEKRVALVIGNAAYRTVGELPNPRRDARDVAAALRDAGFAEVVELYNLGIQQMREALAAFEDKAAGADWAVVYYAGHGIEVDGRNYLVPVDAKLNRASDVEDETLALDRVLARVAAAGKLQLVILDACRNNPFKARMVVTGAAKRAIGERGLARVEPAHSNVLVAYAARDGEAALDGRAGDNSPYARALVKRLGERGLEVGTFFRKVRDDVLAETGGKQRPFEYGSLTGQLLYFRPASASAPGPAQTETARICREVEAMSNPATLAVLERQYKGTPAGECVAARLAQLAAGAKAAPPPKAVITPPPKTVLEPAVQPGPDASAPRVRAPVWTATGADVAAWRLKSRRWLGGALSQTAVSLDRSTIAVTGHREGSLHVIDALTLEPRAKIVLAGYEAYSLGGIAILPGNRRLAVVRSGSLEVYDIASKARVQTIPPYQGYHLGRVSVSMDGQRLYLVRSSINPQRSTIGIYAISPDGLVHVTDHAFNVRVDSLDVTADGGRFLLGTYPTNQLALYDARARRLIWTETCDCSARFGAGERLVAFAGRPGASAGDYGTKAFIGVLDVAEPRRRALFNTKTEESLSVTDVSPDGLMAAVGSTNLGQVLIVPIALDGGDLRPLTILKDKSAQSISGAQFVGGDALVSTSGDNNARLWRK